MLNEFKKFALRGNVMDMAIGIIIGAAFGKIVSTFVAKVVTPAIGMALGGVNFSSLKIVLKEAVGDVPAVAIEYGVFLQTVFDFIIIAFVVFMVVKSMNAAKKKEEESPAEPPKPSEEVLLLREIRDGLSK